MLATIHQLKYPWSAWKGVHTFEIWLFEGLVHSELRGGIRRSGWSPVSKEEGNDVQKDKDGGERQKANRPCYCH
jgi:hypothetical protein